MAYKGDPNKPWSGPFSGDGSYDDYQAAQAQANSPYGKWLSSFDPSQMPAYGSTTGADGNLLPQYQLNAQPDVKFSSDIASQPWMQMLLGQNTMQTNQNVDAANASANSAAATGRSNAAAHGGLTAGMTTNFEQNQAKNALQGTQSARAQGAWNAMNLENQGVQQQANLDSSNRQYKTGVDQTNLATQLSNLQGQNQYNLGKYNTQAQAWGADKTATAMENSGKK